MSKNQNKMQNGRKTRINQTKSWKIKEEKGSYKEKEADMSTTWTYDEKQKFLSGSYIFFQ